MKFKYISALVLAVFIFACKDIAIEKDLKTAQNLNEDLKNVLYYASLAPSGHNTQMWQVVVNDNEWLVKLDSRLLKEVDPQGRESLISIGTFIENMRLAFNAYGYKTDLLISNGPFDIIANPVIAQIKFEEYNTLLPNKEMLEIMEKRHTDKRNFLPVAVDNDIVASLKNEFSGNLLYFPKGSREYKYIKENTYKANETQMFSTNKADELAKWLRFSNKEAVALADGLPAEQLGIKGVKKFFTILL
ncbi:hypothetical protein AAIR98_000004 [Elusimicrobium simillimum]|uniref:hypothetical protein n=1 Tax=Elusimicrobium simillimum TaxID=3143438 RepID=UPI003C6F701C